MDKFGQVSIRSNPSVNSRGCENLNALFGIAYDGTTLNPDPQLGNFGQPIEEKKGDRDRRDTPISKMFGALWELVRLRDITGQSLPVLMASRMMDVL